MGTRETIIAIAAIGALLAIGWKGCEAQQASERRRHERQVECIRRNVYCGQQY